MDIEKTLEEFDSWRREDTEACLNFINTQHKGTPKSLSISWEDEQERILNWWREKLQKKPEYDIASPKGFLEEARKKLES